MCLYMVEEFDFFHYFDFSLCFDHNISLMYSQIIKKHLGEDLFNLEFCSLFMFAAFAWGIHINI